MQANAILIHVCMKCYTYMYGARLKHIGASIITRIVNVQKVGGGGGGGGGGGTDTELRILVLGTLK